MRERPRPPPEPTFHDSAHPGVRIYRPFPAERIRLMHHYSMPLAECPAFEQIDEAVLEPDYRLPVHEHAHYEIVYVHRGIYDRTMANERHRLVAGDLYIVKPGVRHGGAADPAGGALHVFSLAINPSRLPLIPLALGAPASRGAERTDVDADMANSVAEVTTLDDEPLLLDQRVVHGGFGAEAIYRRILAELDRPDGTRGRDRALKVVVVQALLVELLVFVARCQSTQLAGLEANFRAPSRPEFHRLLGWLRSRLLSPPDVVEMAEWIGLSPAHFAVTFKAETGLTPLEYMTRLRIDEAADRLGKPNAPPVTEVALALGYSPHYFSLLFKKCKGSTPRAWRQRHSGD